MRPGHVAGRSPTISTIASSTSSACSLGSTFIDVIDRYARDLTANDSKLMLVSVEPEARREFIHTGLASWLGEENIYVRGIGVVGQTLMDAWADAEAWVAERFPELPLSAEQTASDGE